MLIGWIAFIIAIEFYGISLLLLIKDQEGKLDLKYLIPLYAFFMVSKKYSTFKILTIPVKKCGQTVIVLTVISLISCLIMMWGANNFSAFPEKIEYIKQIMIIPIAVCIFSLYLIFVKSSINILFAVRKEFKFDWILCMLIIPIPFLFSRKVKTV